MGQQRSHVPYRNSMMTQVLRDSLGGNCRTVMIANITAQHEQLDESISTCRFAQRVAMVSNQVCACLPKLVKPQGVLVYICRLCYAVFEGYCFVAVCICALHMRKHNKRCC